MPLVAKPSTYNPENYKYLIFYFNNNGYVKAMNHVYPVDENDYDLRLAYIVYRLKLDGWYYDGNEGTEVDFYMHPDHDNLYVSVLSRYLQEANQKVLMCVISNRFSAYD